jgi:hypothetical protein
MEQGCCLQVQGFLILHVFPRTKKNWNLPMSRECWLWQQNNYSPLILGLLQGHQPTTTLDLMLDRQSQQWQRFCLLKTSWLHHNQTHIQSAAPDIVKKEQLSEIFEIQHATELEIPNTTQHVKIVRGTTYMHRQLVFSKNCNPQGGDSQQESQKNCQLH